MSPIALPRCFAVICVVGTLCLCSVSHAQNYAQNPGRSGFVPLADGPIPEGTTGNIATDSDTAFASNSGNFALSNSAGLSFGDGKFSLTLTNTGGFNNGLYTFLSAFGDFDFVYESMTGRLIRVTSIATDAAIVLTFDLTGAGLVDNTDNSNVPDANPATDDSTTQNGGSLDNSPGNPIAN